MPTFTDPSLPSGSLILVTGVNGLVGSHVANQLLACNYQVRGTVRNIKENAWMVPFFEERFNRKGRFELIEVEEMADEGAFDSVMRGVKGVVHVASNVSISPNTKEVTNTVVAGTIGILNSAAKEGVLRFVLTSSANAALTSKPNNPVVITTETWNEETVELAFNPPEKYTEVQKGLEVYGASKVMGEKALWSWVEENRGIKMVVNSVLPGGNFGKVLSPEHQGFRSTTMFAAALYNNDTEIIETFLKSYAPEWFVDVEDCALLHVAALLYRDVSNERIFAWAEPFNWNVVLGKFREMYPEKTFVGDLEGLWDDEAVVVPRERAEKLLKGMTGREKGFVGLGESLRATVDGC